MKVYLRGGYYNGRVIAAPTKGGPARAEDCDQIVMPGYVNEGGVRAYTEADRGILPSIPGRIQMYRRTQPRQYVHIVSRDVKIESGTLLDDAFFPYEAAIVYEVVTR